MSDRAQNGRIEQMEPWMQTVETILEKAAAEGRRQLYEYEVYEILTELRVKTPTYIIARDERDITHSTLAVFSSERIVLKIISGQSCQGCNGCQDIL